MSRWLVAWSSDGEVELVGIMDEEAEDVQAQIFRETGCRSEVIEAPDIWAALEKTGEIIVIDE
jgi:hypothetical protein